MTTYIICALLLALLQTWLVPAAFNMKNFPWLGSNRDEPMPHELTVLHCFIGYDGDSVNLSQNHFIATKKGGFSPLFYKIKYYPQLSFSR